MTGKRPWSSKRTFGFISLALSTLEIFIIWVGVDLILTSGHDRVLLASRVAGSTRLLAGFGSISAAIVGIVIDSDRRMALAAVVVAIAAFFFCGLRMLV